MDVRGLLYSTHTTSQIPLEKTLTVLSPTGRLVRSYPELALGYGGYTNAHFGASPRYPAAVAVDSRGYGFQVDLTWRSINAGFTVVEVPITFTEREHGVSKMDG